MLTALRKRRTEDEDGFTLIELMVVVLIIAILIAIAIPTFLGAQNRARDRGAQSDLRNAIQAAKTVATDNSGLFVSTGTTPLAATDLSEAEPALSFSDSGGGVGEIHVVTGTAGADILLTTQSASDKWFGIYATSNGEVSYCAGDTEPSSCTDAKW
jgi:type IV pilus assembly protein PilA